MLINMDMTRIGEQGEDSVVETLQDLSKLPILRSVNLGETEIDAILITPFCIYVVEIKNWSGDVDCFLQSSDWVVHNSKGIKSLRSPLNQNRFHINVLQRLVKSKLPYQNLVVFSNPDVVLNRPKLSGYPVFKIDEFMEYYKSRYYALDDKYTFEEQKEFFDTIQSVRVTT